MSRKVLDAIATGRPLAGPETVHVDVTNGCNTNCVTCWDHSPLLTEPRDAAWKRRRVELEDFLDLLEELEALGGTRALVISGMGEPFTHPDVYAMIAAAKARGLHVTVITNLVAADPARVLALGVDELLVGVHAASESSYLAFHPSFRPAEWTRLRELLTELRDAGRRFKHVHVVARCNAHELVDMVRFSHAHGAGQLNFKLASLGRGTEAAAITEAQRLELAEQLVPAAERLARSLDLSTNLDVFAEQLAAGGERTAPIESIGCFMGYAYARVLVDGTVLYCCNVEVRVGSLRDSTFSALWSGDAWNALRDRFRRGEYLASCGQCGKLNQNVKLGRAYARRFGEAALLEATGRGPGHAPTRAPRRLPLLGGPT